MRCLAITLAASVALMAAGCDGMGGAGLAPSPRVALPPERAAASQPADRAVMAYVNGQPVSMDQLYDLLLDGPGLHMAQQLVTFEMVRQQLAKAKLAIDEADVTAENERTLAGMFANVEPQHRQKLLEQFWEKDHIAASEWNLIMRRNAMLTKLAESRLRVTEEDLKAEFAEQYGRKVVVRHIQLGTVAEASRVVERLKSGESFEDIARNESKNPTAKDGGLLPAFGAANQDLPAALRDAAVAMKQPGEISQPVQVQQVYHILRLEQVIPARDVKMDSVKDKLTAGIRQRKIRMLQQEILQQLIREGDIEYMNAALKAKSKRPPTP